MLHLQPSNLIDIGRGGDCLAKIQSTLALAHVSCNDDLSEGIFHAEGLAQWQWQRPPLIFLHPTCLGTMKNLSWC